MDTNDDMPETSGDDTSADNAVPANADASTPEQESVPAQGSAPVQEIAARDKNRKAARKAKAVERKATPKAERVPRVKPSRKETKPGFALEALEPEPRRIVEDCVARVDAIGRKTTDNVLGLGAAFSAMAEAIPDPEHWKTAVVKHCKTSWKFAENWKRAHETFGARREEFVACQVTPTVILKLIKATPEQVDEVLARFKAGDPMKVHEVKALVESGDATSKDGVSAARGGAKDLRRVAAAKLTLQQKRVTEALKAIRQMIVTAAEAAGSKRLEKGKLAKELIPVAKLAHRELTEMLCDIDPASVPGGATLRHLPVEDEAWAKVLRLLARMASDDAWPDASELKGWISGEVMKVLAFALDGVEDGVVADEAEGKVDEDGAGDAVAVISVDDAQSNEAALDDVAANSDHAVSPGEIPAAAAQPGEASPKLPFRRFKPGGAIAPGMLSAEPSMPVDRQDLASASHRLAG